MNWTTPEDTHQILELVLSGIGGGLIGFGVRMTIRNRLLSLIVMVGGCLLWSWVLFSHE